MSQDIIYADAVELAQRIRDRSLSPVEVVQSQLARRPAVTETNCRERTEKRLVCGPLSRVGV